MNRVCISAKWLFLPSTVSHEAELNLTLQASKKHHIVRCGAETLLHLEARLVATVPSHTSTRGHLWLCHTAAQDFVKTSISCVPPHPHKTNARGRRLAAMVGVWSQRVGGNDGGNAAVVGKWPTHENRSSHVGCRMTCLFVCIFVCLCVRFFYPDCVPVIFHTFLLNKSEEEHAGGRMYRGIAPIKTCLIYPFSICNERLGVSSHSSNLFCSYEARTRQRQLLRRK